MQSSEDCLEYTNLNNFVFWDEVCRLCLWKSYPLLHIFSEDGENKGIAKKICTSLPFTITDGLPRLPMKRRRAWTKSGVDNEDTSSRCMARNTTQVSRDDPFPKNICLNCFYKLEVCYDFRAACAKSDEKLKCFNTSTVPPVACVQDEQENIPKLETLGDPFSVESEDIQHTVCSVGMESISGNESPTALGFNDDNINGHNKQQPDLLFKQESWNSVLGEHKERLDTSGNKQWSTDTASADIPDAATVVATVSASASTSTNYLTAAIVATANIPATSSSSAATFTATTAGVAPCHTLVARSNISKDTHEETAVITIPHEEQLHVCSKCSQKFKTKTLLILHYCNTPLSNGVSCRYCDKPFSNMEQLAAHKKVHTFPLSCSCKTCSKIFHTVKALRVHMNSECHPMHNGENNDDVSKKPSVSGNCSNSQNPLFTCDMCTRSCTTAAAFKKHIKSKEHRHYISKLQREPHKSKRKIHTEAKDSNRTPSKLDNKINDSKKDDKKINDETDESRGKPKRVRRNPFLDSLWILDGPKRKYALKHGKQ